MHNSNKILRLTKRLIDVSPDVDVTHVTDLFANCNVVVCTDQDGAKVRLDILDVGKLRWCQLAWTNSHAPQSLPIPSPRWSARHGR